MDNDPDSALTERQVPQPLQPGILLKSVPPTEGPPPYSECVQMQLTPYGVNLCHSGENQKPTNASRSNTEKFNDK